MRDLLNSAFDRYEEGLFGEAIALCRTVLAEAPGHFATLNLLASALSETGEQEAALAVLRDAVAAAPDQPLGRLNLAQMLADRGDFAEALSQVEAGLVLRHDAQGLIIKAGALNGLKNHEKALEALDDARRLDPDLGDLAKKRATVLWNLGRLDEALAAFDAALRADPENADLITRRGHVLQETGDLDAALAALREAQRRTPDSATASHAIAMVLNEMARTDEALTQISYTLARDPDFASAYILRAVIMIARARWPEALADLKRVTEIDRDARAFHRLGELLVNLNYADEGLAILQQGEALDSDSGLLAGAIFHAQLVSTNWSGFAERRAAFMAGIEGGSSFTQPVNGLYFVERAQDQRTLATRFAKERFTARLSDLPAPRQGRDKIRIAFFSPDFCDHPVSDLLKGILANIDRDKFQCVGFSLKRHPVDQQQPVAALFDVFLDVDDWSDRDIVARARAMGIDIAVDLAGYTRFARTEVFALRVAPVQVNYLGYAGTMGVDFYDWIIGDDVLIPAEHEAHYSEPVMRLPGSYMPRPLFQANTASLRRSDYDLPETGVILCGFNNYAKIGPALFSKWLEILKGAPHAVLWLSPCNEARRKRLVAVAAQNGVPREQIIFAQREPDKERHLARLGLADLFLDTAPYNAHITCAEALCAGLPVLTQCGEAYAGRVAASLLCAAGLPDLVARDEAAFISRGRELASNPAALAELRARLDRNRASAPFFDLAGFTRHLEQAFVQMMKA